MSAKDLNNPNVKAEVIFERYGTHYIASAYLGGRLDYTTVTEIDESTSESEISVSVEASYAMVTAKGSTSTGNKKSSRNTKTKTELTVTGGNAEMLSSMGSESAYENWASGIRTRPVLCDFDKTSLLPIWNLCKSATRRSRLKAAFNRMCKDPKYKLPKAMANVVSLKESAYMVKCKDGGLYWDFSGYNTKAKQKSGKLRLYIKDNNSHSNQGFDRIFKIRPNEMEPEWVHLQPQHTKMVLDIAGGSKIANAEVQLWDYRKDNLAQLFKMEPVDGESDTYYIKNKNSGLYFETPKGKTTTKNTVIIQNKFTGKDNQKWVFEKFNPINIAQPKTAYYAIQCAAGNKYWDFPGSYPNIKSNKLTLYKSGKPVGDRIVKIAKVGNHYVIRPDHHNSNVLTAKKNSQLTVSKQTRADNQLFRFEYGGQASTYLIINKKNNQVIDAHSQKTNQNGCPVSMWKKRGSKNQRWILHQRKRKTPIHEGTWYIKMAHSNKYWDLAGTGGATNNNGRNLQIWDLDNGKDRVVKFIPTNDYPYYKIQFQNGGRLLDVGGYWKLTDMSYKDQALYRAKKSNKKKKSDKGANLQIWEKSNKKNQLWKIVYVGNGIFNIVSKYGTAVDASGGKINNNGCNLQMWKYNKKNRSQQFMFINTKTKKVYKY